MVALIAPALLRSGHNTGTTRDADIWPIDFEKGVPANEKLFSRATCFMHDLAGCTIVHHQPRGQNALSFAQESIWRGSRFTAEQRLSQLAEPSEALFFRGGLHA